MEFSGPGRKREEYPSADAALLAHFSPTAVVVTAGLRVEERRGDLERWQAQAAVGRKLKGPWLAPIQDLVAAGGGSWEDGSLRLTVLPTATPDSESRYCVIFESRDLERELESTRSSLANLLIESETTSEELRAAVEELRSANQELREVNAELTSSSQEVARLNARLDGRTKELERANAELSNLIESLRMPIVVLGADLRLKRFTRPAERVLASDCAVVLTTQTPVFRDFQLRPGRVLEVMIRPLVSEERQSHAVLLAIIPGPPLKI
jgi:hypothetical protein